MKMQKQKGQRAIALALAIEDAIMVETLPATSLRRPHLRIKIDQAFFLESSMAAKARRTTFSVVKPNCS